MDVGGHLLQYPRVAFLRIREKGWIGHPDVRFGILWEQGTGDTDAGTSQAAYQASWQEMRAAIDALGFTGKWFVAQESLTAGGVTSAAVRAAQAALVDNVRVFALGDTDALGGANRQVDGIHFSDAGNAAVATLFRPAIAAQYP